MLRKLFYAVFFILLLTGSIYAANYPEYIYAIRTEDHGETYSVYLSKIDIQTDQVLSEIKVDKLYDFLSLSPNGDLLLSDSKADGMSTFVDILIKNDNKVKNYIRTQGSGPGRVYSAGEKNHIIMYSISKERDKQSGVDIYENDKPWKKIKLDNDWYLYSDQASFSLDKKYLYIIPFEMGPLNRQYITNIMKIDVERGTIVKQHLENDKFACGRAIVEIPNNKLYIYGSALEPGEHKPIPKDVVVYNSENLKYLNKIKAHPYIYGLIYAKDINKVIGYRRSQPDIPYIDIIDPDKDKMYSRILVGFTWDATYVGNGKLYVTEIGEDPGLLIIDINKKQIINKIPGEFINLSRQS